MKKEDEREILREGRELLNGAQSLVLATIDAEGLPLASYAPFVHDDAGDFFVFVSGLARHAANLRRGRVSAMIIEDEGRARRIFARRRLVFDCDVEEIPREGEPGMGILQRLRERHGAVVEVLTTLPDFVLYRLRPRNGVFVKGFGRAYGIDPGLAALAPIDPRT